MKIQGKLNMLIVSECALILFAKNYQN